ncbi:DUF305 domain-containing protein [Arthrobacter cryoconiti]|uniref:DUF305 domain-containing protein n=1 Tax=Arthrobacter cryoconiti TaxID=748907 RepID=A0ABV8R3Q4_9MICC|nr:DUF305 domain-containing protein [Arthrobacter cryoconiti]MCC9066761.1 DUF305 domain-containing protein [Arthrobacter cryoconiti]
MKKILPLSATALAALIALSGCSTDTNGSSMPGMDHGSSAMSTAPPTNVGTETGADHNAADAMFAQSMLPHHSQAVEMSDIMLAKPGMDAKIVSLAKDIKAAQGPEITTMTNFLNSWGESTTMTGNHSMAGMLAGTDLDKLKASQGTEAAKMFLTQMTAHHEGALEMAKIEVSGGKNAEAVTLAKSIVSSQEAEIKAMTELLATL